MFNILKHTLAALIAVLVVITSGGIGIFHHSCNKAGSTSRSILYTSQACHGDEGACCGQDGATANGNAGITDPDLVLPPVPGDEGNCCSYRYTYYRVDQVSLPKPMQDPSLQLVSLYIPFQDVSFDDIETQSPAVLAEDRSPPPLSGKRLIIRLHQLKFDPLLA